MKLKLSDPMYHCVETDTFTVHTYGDGNTTRARVIYPFNYYPQKDKTYPDKFPVLFFIQGSGWTWQDLGLETPQLATFARKGMVVVVLSYRDSSLVHYPTQVNDVMDSIYYFLTNETPYPIDMTNVFIAGDSSGAHTAILAAWRLCDRFSGIDPSIIKGVIDYYGPCDLKQLLLDEGYKPGDDISESMEGKLFNMKVFDPEDPIFEMSNIYHEIENGKYQFPLMIIHGDADTVVDVAQSAKLQEVCYKANVPAVFLEIEDGVHGGDLIFSDTLNYKVCEYMDHQCVKGETLFDY